MRPSNFTKFKPSIEWPMKRIKVVYCESDERSGFDKWGVSTQFDTKAIHFITSGDEHPKLVDFYDPINAIGVHTVMIRKCLLLRGVQNARKIYWRKWYRREYQRVIAQWLQRELEFPGEIAELISSFA